jgi:hypothetical protein
MDHPALDPVRQPWAASYGPGIPKPGLIPCSPSKTRWLDFWEHYKNPKIELRKLQNLNEFNF